MRMRAVAAVGTLAAWGAGMAALAERELSRTLVDKLAEASVRVSPVAAYFAVERGGRHVGFTSFTTDTVPEGLQFTDYAVTEDASGARRMRQVTARASRTLLLRTITVREGTRLAVATVIGDSSLRLVRDGDRGADTTILRFAPPLLLPALVPMVAALGPRPSVGDDWRFDVFDPATLAVRAARVRVRAESTWVVVDSAALDDRARRWRGVHADTVRAWHVVEDGPTRRIDTWVDEQGQLVASTGTEGERSRRTAYEIAFENWRTGASAAAAAPAPAGVAAPHQPLARLTVVARGLPLARLATTSAWQRVSGDTVDVVMPSVPPVPNGYWIPPHRDHRARFARELQVEPFIEVEAPEVAATARRLRGREPNPLLVARLLARWVADSIAIDDAPTPPSAVATLRSHAGGESHRVHAYVALARASGIPARPVRGVRAVADRGLASAAWAEVWLGGEWVPVELQGGALPADAAHLRLLVGGATLRADLDRLLSRSDLAVVRWLPLGASIPSRR